MLNDNLSPRAYAVNHKGVRGRLRNLRLYREDSVILTGKPSTIDDERAFGVHCMVWSSGVRTGLDYPGGEGGGQTITTGVLTNGGLVIKFVRKDD